MTDSELLQRAFEGVGRVDAKIDTLITDGRAAQRETVELRKEVRELRKELAKHARDDEERFALLRLTNAQLATEVTGKHKAIDVDAHRAELASLAETTKVVEASKTERWKVAAGVVGTLLALLGTLLLGRASAPVPQPYPPPGVVK